MVSFDEDVLGQQSLPGVSSPLYHSAPTTCLNSPAPTTGSSTPYADKFNKIAILEKSKEPKSSQSPKKKNDAVDSNSDMSVRRKVKEISKNPFEDEDDESESIQESPSEEQSYNEVLENLLAMQNEQFGKPLTSSSFGFENSNLSYNSNVPNNDIAPSITIKSKIETDVISRPNTLHNEHESGSYKSSLSNFSGESHHSR